MSSFSDTRAVLLRRLESRDAARVYEEAKTRHPVLRRYPTLLAALAEISGLDGNYGRRDLEIEDAFLRALLLEHRDRSHAVWTAALMAAFFTAISGLKKRLVSSVHDDGGKQDLVIDAWLEAVARVARISDRDRLALRLTQEMERHAFRTVRAAYRQHRLVHDVVALARDSGEIEPFGQRRADAVDHVGDRLLEIHEAVRGAHEGDERQVARRLESAATLRDRFRERYADLPAEDQEQIYQRIKRRGTRVAMRVKRAADYAEREAEDAGTRRPALRRRRKGDVR